ncbi:MAG: hypothetical protein AAF497_18295, partial [Planctomycetota bacterium]
QDGPFDVVLIDGVQRLACVQPSVDSIGPRGVILVDDSDTKHAVGIPEKMAELGFRHLHFTGMKKGTIRRQQTTLFYCPDNCFNV